MINNYHCETLKYTKTRLSRYTAERAFDIYTIYSRVWSSRASGTISTQHAQK